MNFTTKLLFAMVLLCLQQQAQSQVWSDNLLKYWYYRDRLEYFVMPGNEAGIGFSMEKPKQKWTGQLMKNFRGITITNNLLLSQNLKEEEKGDRVIIIKALHRIDNYNFRWKRIILFSIENEFSLKEKHSLFYRLGYMPKT